MVEMEGQLILTDVGVGDMVVAARFTEDGELYRGKVISCPLTMERVSNSQWTATWTYQSSLETWNLWLRG